MRPRDFRPSASRLMHRDVHIQSTPRMIWQETTRSKIARFCPQVRLQLRGSYYYSNTTSRYQERLRRAPLRRTLVRGAHSPIRSSCVYAVRDQPASSASPRASSPSTTHLPHTFVLMSTTLSPPSETPRVCAMDDEDRTLLLRKLRPTTKSKALQRNRMVHQPSRLASTASKSCAKLRIMRRSALSSDQTFPWEASPSSRSAISSPLTPQRLRNIRISSPRTLPLGSAQPGSLLRALGVPERVDPDAKKPRKRQCAPLILRLAQSSHEASCVPDRHPMHQSDRERHLALRDRV